MNFQRFPHPGYVPPKKDFELVKEIGMKETDSCFMLRLSLFYKMKMTRARAMEHYLSTKAVCTGNCSTLPFGEDINKGQTYMDS